MMKLLRPWSIHHVDIVHISHWGDLILAWFVFLNQRFAFFTEFLSFLFGDGGQRGGGQVVIHLMGVTHFIFVFLSSVGKVVPERQWRPNTSWVMSPECLEEAPKSRWVCDVAHFETLSYMKCKRLHNCQNGKHFEVFETFYWCKKKKSRA